MNWNKKKYDFPAWVFCFIFSESKCQIYCGNFLSSYPTLLAIFSVLPPHPDFLSHLHLPALFAFFGVLPLLLHYCVLTTTENSVNIKEFYFKSCSPFWWWCWIFNHLPCMTVVQFPGTNFYYIFPSLVPVFSADFPICLFEGSLFTELAGFFLFWCHLFWWVMCLNDLLRKAMWKLNLSTTTIGKCLSWYYYRSLSFQKHD